MAMSITLEITLAYRNVVLAGLAIEMNWSKLTLSSVKKCEDHVGCWAKGETTSSLFGAHLHTLHHRNTQTISFHPVSSYLGKPAKHSELD